jgi:signal peptidase I
MTFPPNDEPSGTDELHGAADSGFQPQADAFAPPSRPEAGVPVSEADLFTQDASAAEVVTSAEWPPVNGAQEDRGAERLLSAPAEIGLPIAVAGALVTTGATRHRFKRVAWELVQTLVLALVIFLLVRAVAQNFRVEGPSMEPGLQNGQYLLVNKGVYFKLNLGTLSKYIPFIDAKDGDETFLFHGPQRGDVIVFRYPKDPDRDFIKRVIGVPGDRVRVEAGLVYINSVPLQESYISSNAGRDIEELVVPARNYFVLGDNRPNSSDSRQWGFVPEDNIIGKAMLSYWPLKDLGGAGNHHVDLGFIRLPLP